MVVAGSVGVKKTARIATLMLFAAASPVVLSACQSDPDIDITKLTGETESSETLYNQGLANLKAGKVGEANRKFEAVDRQNPFSEEARKALVMAAFTNYRQGRNEEAITSAKRYLALYPGSQDAAYAQYIIGLAYWKQIPSVTQDQRASAQTLEAMQAVVDNYPDSEYVEDAQAKIRFARDQLAGREMTYALGSRDIKVATKYDVISPESPIGAAILGANEGDTVSYKAPNGREISVVIKEAKPLS